MCFSITEYSYEVDDFSAFNGIDTTKDSHASPRESTEHTDERPAERFPDDDGPVVEKKRIIANESNRSESIRNTADASPKPTVDPSNMLLFRLADQISRLSADRNASASSDPIRIKQAVGELKASEGIFAFFNKFETVMSSKGIHENLWLNHLAPLLTGRYCEAFSNFLKYSSTYSSMRSILLDVGGYSVSECLDTLDIKYRHGGSLSLMEWFTRTMYKFEVILDSLSFLSHCNNKMIESMAKTFSLIGVLGACRRTGENLFFLKKLILLMTF